MMPSESGKSSQRISAVPCAGTRLHRQSGVVEVRTRNFLASSPRNSPDRLSPDWHDRLQPQVGPLPREIAPPLPPTAPLLCERGWLGPGGFPRADPQQGVHSVEGLRGVHAGEGAAAVVLNGMGGGARGWGMGSGGTASRSRTRVERRMRTWWDKNEQRLNHMPHSTSRLVPRQDRMCELHATIGLSSANPMVASQDESDLGGEPIQRVTGHPFTLHPLCPFLTLVCLVDDDLSIVFFSLPAPTSSPPPPDCLLAGGELLCIGDGRGAGRLGLALGLPAPASSVPGKEMRDKAEAAREVGARRVSAISWSVRLLARTTTVWTERGPLFTHSLLHSSVCL